MPIEIQNNIHIKGNIEDINRILKAIQDDELGIGTIDFNKIIPMPKSLMIEKGMETNKGLEAYQEFIKENIPENKIKDMDTSTVINEQKQIFLNKNKSISEETFELGKIAFENILKYGHPTFHDWSIENWGTQWNAYQYEQTKDSICFLTAYSPPHPVIEKLSQMYPNIEIHYDFASEDFGKDCGKKIYTKGKCLEYYPKTKKEAVEFATKVWNYETTEINLNKFKSSDNKIPKEVKTTKTTPIKNLSNNNYKQVITDILENYKQNPEDLIELAKFSKNFTKYSINNDILLYKQNSGATFVATYNQWQNLGYKVIEKGSGIRLLQPNTITFFYNENNQLKPIREATKIEQEKIKSKEYKTVRKIVSFSPFIVHDISATNCPVEEYPNFYNMGYSSDLHKNIADALIDYCSENKILVSEEDLNSISIRGVSYDNKDVIKLNSLMKDTEKLSVLLHEIGHIKLHRDNEQTNKKSTALKEFEADLLSIMFSTDYNLEIIDTRKQHFVSSFNAIDKENFDLMKTLNEVHKEYKKLSKEFDKYIDKQLTINNISLDNDLEKNRLSKIKEILDNGNYIQKSIIEAKAGEFCIGENKNPLQIIEKNGNEYKAIDLVTKKEISSNVEIKLENKDINNIASVPILQKNTEKETTQYKNKINTEKNSITLTSEDIKLEDIDFKKLIGQAINYEGYSYTIENIKDNRVELNRPNDNPALNSIIVNGVNINIPIKECETQLKSVYSRILSDEKAYQELLKSGKNNQDVATKPQGYKKYNLDEIKQIPIKTILDDLGYEKARNGMYNLRGENTASVKVYENTNSYYDFGSTNGGSVINLIKETQNLDTKEAINFLGEKYGIPYEQIGVDNTEKRLFLSNKDWKNLGILYPEQSSKNYAFDLFKPQDELRALSEKLQKINMNDLSKKEPQIFKEIVENNVIPSYMDERNNYLHNLYISTNADKLFKKRNDIEFSKYFHNDLAKQQFLELKKNYNNLKKINEFIPDLKIDKLSVNFEKDLKNINNKSIEIGIFAHRDMKQIEGNKNYLTLPYKNFKSFEEQAQDLAYSAFLKGDKVTLTVLNTDKQEAQEIINQVKQLDFQKQSQKKLNTSLEK